MTYTRTTTWAALDAHRAVIANTSLRELFAAIETELFRYPAIDPVAFRAQVDAELG